MSNQTENFSGGTFINMGLIIGGLAALLWLSTFGDNDIASKAEYYGTQAGQFVFMALFMIPFFVLMRSISSSTYTKKQLAKRIFILISFQFIVMSFAPNILKVYSEAGRDIGDMVIEMKNN
jgi:hypothetical protein